MVTGIRAYVQRGYTGWDHLIDESDTTAATYDALLKAGYSREEARECKEEL